MWDDVGLVSGKLLCVNQQQTKDKGVANSSEIKKIASVKGYKNAKKYV